MSLLKCFLSRFLNLKPQVPAYSSYLPSLALLFSLVLYLSLTAPTLDLYHLCEGVDFLFCFLILFSTVSLGLKQSLSLSNNCWVNICWMIFSEKLHLYLVEEFLMMPLASWYYKYNIAYDVFTNVYKINICCIIMLLFVFLQVGKIQWKIWKPFVLVSMEVIFGHLIA